MQYNYVRRILFSYAKKGKRRVEISRNHVAFKDEP
jgi:hypothetical protein